MKKTGKLSSFLKRNASYLVVVLCILAIGLTATFVAINNARGGFEQGEAVLPNEENKPNQDNSNNGQTGGENEGNNSENEQPVIEVISFIMPVASSTSVGEYSEQMVFNSTLGRFNAHMAIDFFAEEGTDVYAVYKGTVESVVTELITGTTIVIDHGNGLKTIYNSLLDGDDVSVGQVVEQGEVIGQVSASNRQEYKAGAHLHFQVEENGEIINPAKYLSMQEK